jgi:tRNA(Phe) wybutosine-synthesizing methylase Tyw3
MSLVTQQKFDELVKNTTAYLQDVLQRIDVLEDKVEQLSAASKPTRRVAKEATNEQ